jgi:hypothetical protein
VPYKYLHRRELAIKAGVCACLFLIVAISAPAEKSSEWDELEYAAA